MGDIVLALQDTPVPTVLVVGGLVFLFLGVVGRLTGQIQVPAERQKWAGVIGGVLLLSGVALYAIPVSTSTPASSPTSTPLTPVRTQNSNDEYATQEKLGAPTPELAITGTETFLYEVGGEQKQGTRYHLSIANWADFPTVLFESAPDLPPCGLNTNASRTWVEISDAKDNRYIYGFCAFSSPQSLNSIWFAVSQDESPPEAVFVTLRDRREGITYRSSQIPLP